MVDRVKKAVFPVAGLGTRFLPATKANPKEMLPVVDKPLIQYAAEEAVEAGIEELIFITGRNKRAIPDHFDKAYELEAELEKNSQEDLLTIVKNILPSDVSCIYIRQHEPLGLGHAVLCARPVIGDEPFAILLADDLICGDAKGCLRQMVEQFQTHKASIIAVESVAADETERYGIIEGQSVGDRVSQILRIIEKPSPQEAPSNLAVAGRYILPGRIMEILEKTSKGIGDEIQLTDAIAVLLESERVVAYEFFGERYDCGNKLGYLQAMVDCALKHPEVHADFRAWLMTRI